MCLIKGLHFPKITHFFVVFQTCGLRDRNFPSSHPSHPRIPTPSKATWLRRWRWTRIKVQPWLGFNALTTKVEAKKQTNRLFGFSTVTSGPCKCLFFVSMRFSLLCTYLLSQRIIQKSINYPDFTVTQRQCFGLLQWRQQRQMCSLLVCADGTIKADNRWWIWLDNAIENGRCTFCKIYRQQM